jgi:hypothetical protein
VYARRECSIFWHGSSPLFLVNCLEHFFFSFSVGRNDVRSTGVHIWRRVCLENGRAAECHTTSRFGSARTDYSDYKVCSELTDGMSLSWCRAILTLDKVPRFEMRRLNRSSWRVLCNHPTNRRLSAGPQYASSSPLEMWETKQNIYSTWLCSRIINLRHGPRIHITPGHLDWQQSGE